LPLALGARIWHILPDGKQLRHRALLIGIGARRRIAVTVKNLKEHWTFSARATIITNMMNIIVNICCSCTTPEALATRGGIGR
jgi:hypothetical protein